MDNKLSKEWLHQNQEKLKKAYTYALVNHLDIRSTTDVLEILQSIDPNNATNEQAIIFSQMLQLFSQTLKKTLKKKNLLN
ncbi:hypothetical protein M1116_01485 [Patescibacteria group bacterium]|nr:hypothetical protein [Patescibacteria group bacterium]